MTLPAMTRWQARASRSMPRGTPKRASWPTSMARARWKPRVPKPIPDINETQP